MYLRISCIYKIVSPSGKTYIGRTIDMRKRMRTYARLNCEQQIHLYRSLKKYGWKNHKFSIVRKCPVCKLDDLEIYYIKKFNSFVGNNKMGLNLTTGGDGGQLSEESLEKIRIKSKAFMTPERIEWLRQLNIGKKMSEESKNLMRLAKLGKKRSPQVIANFIKKMTGQKRTPEQNKRRSEMMRLRFNFLPYDEARKWVLENLVTQGVNSQLKWRKTEKPKNIPTNPDKIYKDSGWNGWGSFLGTGNGEIKKLKSFEDAQAFAKELKITSKVDWFRSHKEGIIPKDIPKYPNYTYKNNEWCGWRRFLHEKRTSKKRSILGFENIKK